MDPVKIIRDHVVKGTIAKSTNDDTFIYIEEQSFYRKGQTNYKTARGYLTVEAVWRFARVFAAEPDKKHAEYMKETIADKFGGARLGALVQAHQTRKLVALRAGDDEAGSKKDEDEDEDDAVGGDNAVQDALASELKFQTKLYQAQQYIEEKKDEFIQKGEEGKEAMDAEAKVFRDRASLELGLKASEIDEQLAEMLDQTAAARAKNERVQAELAELEEQLTGTSSGRFRKAPPKGKDAPRTITALKQAAIDKEAADVDARMRNTLEDTQRKSAYTLILLLLVVTDISLIAEGAWDKFFAIGCVIALVGYQANNERLNK